MRSARTLAILAALLASAGCGKAAEDSAPAASPKTPAAAPAEEPFDPDRHVDRGRHFMPGVSAMNEDTAKAHYGQTLQLTETTATSSAEHCATPKYPTRDVPTEEFLATEFNLPPESLKRSRAATSSRSSRFPATARPGLRSEACCS